MSKAGTSHVAGGALNWIVSQISDEEKKHLTPEAHECWKRIVSLLYDFDGHLIDAQEAAFKSDPLKALGELGAAFEAGEKMK